MGEDRPLGTVTRGTTAPNRLRRCDRWLTGPQAWRLREAPSPLLVVDLGYGRCPVTTVELHDRLSRVRSDTEVVGIEIDPERVTAARPLTRAGLRFRVGGFEVPTEGDRPVTVIRAFNVLRQYGEGEVATAWARMTGRLATNGIVIDGTCDESGRVTIWVTLDRTGPISLTMSMRLAGLESPTVMAERLPKALIHRNTPGEPIHELIRDLDRAWRYAAPHSSFGARARFVATVEQLRSGGWPVLDGPNRWRMGEVSVAWDAVAPRGGLG